MKIKKPESVPVYPHLSHSLSDLEKDFDEGLKEFTEGEMKRIIKEGTPIYVSSLASSDPSACAAADIAPGVYGTIDTSGHVKTVTASAFAGSYTDRFHFDLDKIEKFDEISKIYRSWYPSDPAEFDVESFKELPGKIMREFASALIDEISKNDELLTLADVVKYLKKKLKLDK